MMYVYHQNVMLDASGHVVLIDYGLSKQEVSDPRGALSLVGTPDYSAPGNFISTICYYIFLIL
jgi:serine/threonine protein kinase